MYLKIFSIRRKIYLIEAKKKSITFCNLSCSPKDVRIKDAWTGHVQRTQRCSCSDQACDLLHIKLLESVPLRLRDAKVPGIWLFTSKDKRGEVQDHLKGQEVFLLDVLEAMQTEEGPIEVASDKLLETLVELGNQWPAEKISNDETPDIHEK